MSLTKEQIDSLKHQLREQVKSLPEDKKHQALKQIEEMSDEAIESLLNQERAKSADNQKSIFRMILDGEIESVKVAENTHAVAVLDINPISKGHALIIPKKETKEIPDLPSQAFTLAKSLSKILISKLKAKSSEIQTEKKFGEAIIHVIPIYDTPLTLNSPRQKSSLEELDKISALIKIVKKEKLPVIKPKKKSPEDSKVIKLKRHIP